jgi:hypothetical protein
VHAECIDKPYASQLRKLLRATASTCLDVAATK